MIWREGLGIQAPRQVGIYMSVRHHTSVFTVWISLRMRCGTNASSGESRRITVAHLMAFTEDGHNLFTVLSSWRG